MASWRVRRAGIEDLRSVLLPVAASAPTVGWSPRSFEAEFDNPVSRLWVAECDGRGVGFIVTWFVGDEVHILNVAVDPGWRRRGIGGGLVQRVLEAAAEAGAAFVTLEVRVGNAPAIGLYERMGFVLVGRRKGYYQDNGEDALLLGYVPG